VVFLDPAVGTGTYPVAAIKSGLEKVAKRSGKAAVPARARQMAENMYGFEVLVGPYAVAHLRLTQALEGAINDLKEIGAPDEKLGKRLKIYLADTLESPNSAPPGGLDLTHKALTQEHEAARKVKNGGEILVCLGNPPYDRQNIEEGDTTTQRKGGWVRFGDQLKGGTKQEVQGVHTIFKDFTEPATKAGAGVHLKNLYNDYVYFWRWALWRTFERQQSGGIITFITASSFLGGPAFVGMRQYMRREFDEIYVINLGGDLLGTRKTPNVFNIQTPVAITLGIRSGNRQTSKPAEVKYLRIEAQHRQGKLEALEALGPIGALPWEKVSDGWMDPFYPRSNASYFFWPELIDIFP
jgi:predicted helicase